MDQILYIVRMDILSKKPEEPEKNEQAENDEDGNLMKGKRAKISTPGGLLIDLAPGIEVID